MDVNVMRSTRGDDVPQAVAEVTMPMVQVRFDGDQWDLIRAAARMKGMTPWTFVRAAILEATINAVEHAALTSGEEGAGGG